MAKCDPCPKGASSTRSSALGTGFLHLLEGVIEYGHGRSVYLMEPGDSLTIDAKVRTAHEVGRASGRFPSVIAVADGT
jgi:hypothetical protein